jgi:type II secretory pathway pseudopilin PulG
VTRGSNSQKGYVLLMVLFLLAVLTITLLAASQSVVTQIRRDREQEMVHRGQQYVRAIRRYYRKFGRFPAKIEDLETANNIRFLRRRYKDPMTPSGEWKVLHYGEAKNPPLGLFGKPITVATGLGGSTPGTNTVGGTPAGGLSTPAGGLGGMSPGGPAAGQPHTPDNGDANTNVTSGQNSGANATGAAPVSSATQVQGFGGGAVIGVESLSTKESIKEIGGKNHYNEWEFVYDPRVEAPAQAGQAGQVQQQNGQSLGNPIAPNPQQPQTPQAPQ